ncbi:MAG: hypothetical protein KJ645_06250 [Planctomycetes bacterium]|nr:hypothetical protein [Planctomycetota bacterium]
MLQNGPFDFEQKSRVKRGGIVLTPYPLFYLSGKRFMHSGRPIADHILKLLDHFRFTLYGLLPDGVEFVQDHPADLSHPIPDHRPTEFGFVRHLLPVPNRESID